MGSISPSRSYSPLVVVMIAVLVFIGGILWGWAGSRHHQASGSQKLKISGPKTSPNR